MNHARRYLPVLAALGHEPGATRPRGGRAVSAAALHYAAISYLIL
jgi:hypothetical protein